jgi:preprotein translocase subunit Sec61beta
MDIVHRLRLRLGRYIWLLHQVEAAGIFSYLSEVPAAPRPVVAVAVAVDIVVAVATVVVVENKTYSQ